MAKAASALSATYRSAVGASRQVVLQALVAALSGALLSMSVAGAAIKLGWHPEWVDSLLFIGSFTILLPLCLLTALFLAGSERGRRGLPAAAVLTPSSLVVLLALARLLGETEHSGHGPALLVLGGSLTMLLAWALLLYRGPWAPLERATTYLLARPEWMLGAVGAVLLWVFALLFAPPAKVTASNLALALAVAAAVGAAYALVRPTRLSKPFLVIADVAVVVLILAITLDLTAYETATSPDFGFGDPASVGLTTRLYQQGPYLAAVNDVLHGRALLVGTSSQYGVGSIYLLAGLFKIAPIGYGPFGLIATLFTGIEFALGFAIMRIASSRWLLAAALATVAVAAGAITQSTAYLPSQGGLRFVLPLALLFLALRGIRRPAHGTPSTAGVLAVLAISSVWSIETFVFTAAVYLGVVAYHLALESTSFRLAWRVFARQALVAGGVCLASLALLSVTTRVLAGGWPDWHWYLEYARAYSNGPAQLPVGSWSPVWLLGVVYFASLGGAIWLATLRRSFVRENLVHFTAIVGTSITGLAYLVYFVNRSVDILLLLLALPAFMLVCLWLDLALSAKGTRSIHAIAVATTAWIAALLVIACWPLTSGAFKTSALGHAIPGGRSLTDDASSIWNSPPIDPRSVEAQRLIDDHFPSQSDALLFIEPDLGTETLMRSRHANALPISFPAGHGIVPSSWLSRLKEDVAGLPAGSPVLLQRHPPLPDGTAPLPVGPLYAERVFGQVNPDRWLSPPAEIALRMVKGRFTVEPIAMGRYGLYVGKLVPKGKASPGEEKAANGG